MSAAFMEGPGATTGRRGGRGRLVVLAGIDGSGKTMQAARLSDALAGRGHDVVATKAPGGTPLGARLRAMLLDSEPLHRSVDAEALMFLADRAEHVDSVIAPALARGAVVVCDRYTESTLAYQGARMADGETRILAIHAMMGWPVPDLTLHLRIDPDLAARRIALRASPDKDPDAQTLRRLAERYDRIMAEIAEGRIATIDAAMGPNDVAASILEATLAVVGEPVAA